MARKKTSATKADEEELDDAGVDHAIAHFDLIEQNPPEPDETAPHQSLPDNSAEALLDAYANLDGKQIKVVCDAAPQIHGWAVFVARTRFELIPELEQVGTMAACAKVIDWDKALGPFVTFVKKRVRGSMIDFRRKVFKYEARHGYYRPGDRLGPDGEPERLSNERISVGQLLTCGAHIVTHLPVSTDDAAMRQQEIDMRLGYLRERYEAGERGAVIIVNAIEQGISLRAAGRIFGWDDSQVKVAIRQLARKYKAEGTAQDRTPIGRVSRGTAAARRKSRWMSP